MIGGGDGGVLREIVKHDCVEEVTLVEIDEAVVKAAKKFLPAMAVGFQHPKVKLHIGDGFEYLKNNESSYDVIITDSSDPVGPAESLFGETFYGLMRKALLPEGIICTQGEQTALISWDQAAYKEEKIHAPRLDLSGSRLIKRIHHRNTEFYGCLVPHLASLRETFG